MEKVNAIPLVDIRKADFFRTLDINSKALADLRVNVDRHHGYFMIRHRASVYSEDVFPLAGGVQGLSGQWFLAKVEKTSWGSSFDYEIQIYRKAAIGQMKGKVLCKFIRDKEELARTLSTYVTHGLVSPDSFMMSEDSETFTLRGFDVA